MEENVIQINSGIKTNVDLCVKSVMYVQKIMFGILLHIFVKIKNIYQLLWMIQRLHVMKSYYDTMKKQILMKKKEHVKRKISIFYFLS